MKHFFYCDVAQSCKVLGLGTIKNTLHSLLKLSLLLFLFVYGGNVKAQTFTVTGGNTYLITAATYEQYCGDITGFSSGVNGLINTSPVTITTSSPVTSISFILGSIGQGGYEVHRCDAIGITNEVLSVPSSCSGLLTIVGNTVKNVNLPGVATRITVSSVTPFSQVVITNVSGSASVMLPSSVTVCNPGASPVLSTTNVTNVCPSPTINLNNLVTSTLPVGSTLVWFTNSSHSGTAYATPTAAGAGTYYAFYSDATGSCYSPASSAVTATTASCCIAGTTAPTLASTPQTNICPDTTVNLTTITASNLPANTVLTWHTGTPATTANKILGTAVTAGTYYTAFYDAANDCYSPTTAVTTTVVNCVATGTIDCSKTQITTIPVLGTIGQKSLVVTINVTQAGCFTPLSLSGSGMSLANATSSVCTTTTGIQQFVIPTNYNGTALGTMTFTVGSAGSCSADLNSLTGKKKVVTDVWTLENCSLVQVGPSLK